MGVRKMPDSGELSWEAQEVLQKIKSFNRLPGAGIPLIQLNMRVGSAKTVKKGIPELKSAGLITDAASGEPTLTDNKATRPQFDPECFIARYQLRQLGDIRRNPPRLIARRCSVCITLRQSVRGSLEPSPNRQSTTDSGFNFTALSETERRAI
jgi:hypothetical protein